MKRLLLCILCTILLSVMGHTQIKPAKQLSAKKQTPAIQEKMVSMPYNRLIQSAGKVIRFGNPNVENHALDLCLLPNKKHIAVEDRYGIIILNSLTKTIVADWRFEKDPQLKNLISTFSGISSFVYQNNSYITWGACDRGGNKAAIMLASWDGNKISNVTSIPVEPAAPAEKAIPNQVLPNWEDNNLYLYAVLNGNNQLLKIKFADHSIVWAAGTGVAPYGIAINGNKAYVTNWAGPLVTDTSKENAGTPWGAAYTNPATGATQQGSLSVIDINTGQKTNELMLGLHPNAMVKSKDNKFLYIANGSSDYISVVDIKKEVVTDSIETGLFSRQHNYFGSSPNALLINESGTKLYVANGMDNAICVVDLNGPLKINGKTPAKVSGYIPTEAYPSGILELENQLYVSNLEARGSAVLAASDELKEPSGKTIEAYSIHKELASVSIIPLPNKAQLNVYTTTVKKLNLYYRMLLTYALPRKNMVAKPVPERLGEPSIFKHVVYIIKENKTYDQVYGDIPGANGNAYLCIFGEKVTPNQHQLVKDFSLMDNYFASGKSSAEGHQWVDAGMVSDYIEKNVRAWFRSYPHRQEDALVYNKGGFIWNNALDHGKTVRVYGEACTTHYEASLKWTGIFDKYQNHEPTAYYNTSTIARLRPIISPAYPDCDNIHFPDQLRADIFIEEWKQYEANNNLPNLLVLSLPNDHTAGMSQDFPTPRAMVADNDLALGRIIETISKSKYWDETVVFVTQDDSQSGWDHVSAYRTTGLVISAYSQLQKTISTSYNQTSMLRTIEQILGIPPMNIVDATATPMFDCFSTVKKSFQYQVIPTNIPLNEMNKPVSLLKGRAQHFARLSASRAFKDIDSGDDKLMNQILWFNAKGTAAYPSGQ